jgi:hypothetical protein
MSRYNRGPLPVGEEKRLETLNEKILAALKGPKTNKSLSLIALDYGRRIRALRSENHFIRQEHIDGGLRLYSLLSKPEPEWIVEACVELNPNQPFGRKFLLNVHVRANDAGTARNRAQHLATRVTILRARRVPEPDSESQ